MNDCEISSTQTRRRDLTPKLVLAQACVVMTLCCVANAQETQDDGRVATRYHVHELTRDTDVQPRRMNASGVFVGQHSTGVPIRSSVDGGHVFLPLASPDASAGVASGVNEAGDAVGWQSGGAKPVTALLWPAAGEVVELFAGLTTPDTRTYATAINDLGQVVGSVHDDSRPDGPGKAVIWSANGDLRFLPKPSPSVWQMKGDAINNRGHVAGKLVFKNPQRFGYKAGYYWSPATGVKVFAPATEIADINDNDEVVGLQDDVDDNGQPIGHGHAFYWNPSMGRMPQHLPLLNGFLRCIARGISPDGVIAGYCEDRKPQVRRDEYAAVAWDRQEDGTWQIHELKLLIDKNLHDLATKVVDIDSRNRLLYTVGRNFSFEIEAAGVAVPADATAR
jgi:uncharacterized membrane protein